MIYLNIKDMYFCCVNKKKENAVGICGVFVVFLTQAIAVNDFPFEIKRVTAKSYNHYLNLRYKINWKNRVNTQHRECIRMRQQLLVI